MCPELCVDGGEYVSFQLGKGGVLSPQLEDGVNVWTSRGGALVRDRLGDMVSLSIMERYKELENTEKVKIK